MSEHIIGRVRQRLIDGSMTKEQAAMVLQTLPQNARTTPSNIDLENFNPADFGEDRPQSFPQDKKANPGIMDQIHALVETGVAGVTGATGGTIGGMAGFLEGLAKEVASGKFGPMAGTPAEALESAGRIAETSQERSQQLTIAPKTELGQKRTQQLGEALEPLQSLPPLLAEAGVFAQGVKASAPLAKIAAKQGVSVIDDAVKAVQSRFETRKKDLGRSIGAADTGLVRQRQELAQTLPVPIELTEGQATRDFTKQRFERETAKLDDIGKPIRDRFEEQNLQLQQNIDAFIDETGAVSIAQREVGESVEKALRGRLSQDKARIRALYREAEESGGMNQRADIDDFSDYLNKNRAEREENGIMTKVQRQIEALEIGNGSFSDGSLSLRDVSLKEAEALRRFINRNIKNADPNEIRIGTDLKRIIDSATDGLGDDKYKIARRARVKLARDFENVGLMKQLSGLKKGTEERAIALEDVLRKSVISPSSSRDSLHTLRKVLQNSGEDGAQAWKDIQGGTLQYIQDEMTKNVAINQRGDRVVSPAKLDKAVRDLDNSGKLELLYGKRGAEQIRTINEVAKDVLTSPPGAVNHSNTATVLAGLMDVAISGTTGIPAPILTSGNLIFRRVKDSRLKAKVQRTLNFQIGE